MAIGRRRSVGKDGTRNLVVRVSQEGGETSVGLRFVFLRPEVEARPQNFGGYDLPAALIVLTTSTRT